MKPYSPINFITAFWKTQKKETFLKTLEKWKSRILHIQNLFLYKNQVIFSPDHNSQSGK